MNQVMNQAKKRAKKQAKTTSMTHPTMNCYLHIYRVVHNAGENATSFVSVVSLGTNRKQAEAVAINLVHQHGYHIVATDTATAAPWLSEASDTPYLEDLNRYGVALQELAA